MFTEQFSQHGFKVQIACVNLEILRVAQKGESVSVFTRMLLLEAWTPYRITLLSSSPSMSASASQPSASPSSPPSASPSSHFLESSLGQAPRITSNAHVLTMATRPMRSSALFLLCLPPCSLSSHNGFLAAFDSTSPVPTVGPLHWLFSYWSTFSPSPYPLTHLFQICSSVTFSVRLTLTVLFNHTTFLSFILLISTTLLYRGNFS